MPKEIELINMSSEQLDQEFKKSQIRLERLIGRAAAECLYINVCRELIKYRKKENAKNE